MNTTDKDIHMAFIRTALSSIAAFSIFPLQDLLGAGKEGRMNTPGKAEGNWSWRYKKEDLTAELAKELKALSLLYGRCKKEKED
jgi:4-alpha-glucanotransferase